LFVDFYVKDKNIIIEYNGDQHYEPVCFGGISVKESKQNFIKQQERDKYIEQFCINNSIKLIWIDGRKYKDNKLKKYLIEEIIPLLKDQ
jgi:very-short-patch-repair endonuclease